MRLTFENNGSGELHLAVLKTICGDVSNKSMIDMGCCHSPINSRIGFEKRKYVDIQDRLLDNKDEQQYFEQYNILDYFNDKGGYYDVVLATDVIEHLSKQQGFDFVIKVMLHSDKQVFFTPLGDYMVDPNATNPDSHRSGWLPEDFEQLGWATIVFHKYHPLLHIGAFYAFHCDNTEQEFERISNELPNIIHTL